MKIFKSSWGLFSLAFMLLLSTNAVVLLGAYLNRMDVTAHAILTQRELQMPYRSMNENTGVSLNLLYRTLNREKSKSSYYKSPVWLNATKLKELGFDTDKHPSSNYSKKGPTQEVLVVLEYNGESYKESLALAEENFVQKEALYNAKKNDTRVKRNYEDAQKRLNREQVSESRLFAVDAGLEYEKLRQAYPDKTKYIIVKGVVQLLHQYNTEELFGNIQQLNIQIIHLPYEFKHLIKDVATSNYLNNKVDNTPKYKVEVKYGSRYEPWICSVEKI